MFSSYRGVLSYPGALAFSLTGLVARLPISMAGLGIVLLVSARTGSYGTAGAVSAAYMVANAVLAVLQGRLVDRLGQARVLTVAAGLFGAAMALLVWSVRRAGRRPPPTRSRRSPAARCRRWARACGPAGPTC